MWSHATPEPPIAVSGAAVVAIAPLMDVLALPARLLIKKHRDPADYPAPNPLMVVLAVNDPLARRNARLSWICTGHPDAEHARGEGPSADEVA